MDVRPRFLSNGAKPSERTYATLSRGLASPRRAVLTCGCLRLASSSVSGGGLTIVRKIGCFKFTACKFTAYRRFRTDRRKQRRPNRSGPLTRTALHESRTYNSPVFRFRQVANWHTVDRPPALLRDEASHDHGRWRGAPMVRDCGSGRRGYNNSLTNPAGSFRFAIIRHATTS